SCIRSQVCVNRNVLQHTLWEKTAINTHLQNADPCRKLHSLRDTHTKPHPATDPPLSLRSLSLPHTHPPLSLSLSLTRTHRHLSLSLTHTHTHLSLSLSHTHTYTPLSLSLSLSLSPYHQRT